MPSEAKSMRSSVLRGANLQSIKERRRFLLRNDHGDLLVLDSAQTVK